VAARRTLVVVESPAKGKTIQRWLGPDHQVMATMGHVLDLPEHALGVEVEQGFRPRYEVLKGKNRLLSDLKRAAREAERVLLATDPDREGEAIAWLLAEELGAPGGSARVRRVLLHELTPEAIRAAVAAPRDLDRRRFEAQQARRILDRLVGWQVSPLLWSRVRRGLSAGRVQSVAVRMVVERERAREAFVAAERWGVEVELSAGRGPPLRARLATLDGRPARLDGQAAAEALVQALRQARFEVLEVTRRERAAPPPPAFSTAALQQVAATELGLSPRRAMALAQRLYEGIGLGEDGAVGLLSYMRTDSTQVSPAAAAWGRAWAATAYGSEAVTGSAGSAGSGSGSGSRAFAHEAIRPTSPDWPPERVLPLLGRERDLGRLYRLVWSRFVASLMAPAVHQEVCVRVAVTAGEGTHAVLEAAGAVLTAPGWLLAHADHPPAPEAGGPPAAALPRLPPLEVGQPLGLAALAPRHEVDAPPPRFTEATLVQALEARGLGRPSTFAAIVDTVQARGYVERVERRLSPTALGLRVTDALAEALPRELDVAFTAGLEAELDRIEEGRADWQAVVAGFHGPLQVALARATAARAGAAAATGVACGQCGRPMAVRLGKAGEFLACTGYPACRSTRDFRREGGAIVPEPPPGSDAGQPCPRCAAPMVSRRGRFGRFLSCSRFPACDGKVAPSLGVACPRGCGGEVTERRSKRGRTFYGCSAWPACDFVSWDRPRNEPCPDCGGNWLVEAVSRRVGPVLACPDKDCGCRRPQVGGAP
jgi:DNA topoisomerase I